MTKSKRKLLISMLVMMFVLLSAVAVVAIAFALTQQTITTTLNIGYTVEDVIGSVSATYKIGNNGTPKSLVAAVGAENESVKVTNNGTTLEFDAEGKQTSATLNFPEGETFSELNSTNNYVLIDYTYTNKGARHYVVELGAFDTTQCKNMAITCSADNTTYQTKNTRLAIPVAGVTGEDPITKHYYIKIAIEEVSKNASCNLTLSWFLKGVTQAEFDNVGQYTTLPNTTYTQTEGTDSYTVSLSSVEASDYSGIVSFPSSINGKPVTKIANAYLDSGYNVTYPNNLNLKVKSVYIPASVEEIDVFAFYNYQNLETVTFEQNDMSTASLNKQSNDGLRSINDFAFKDCIKLESITFPNSLTAIKQSAFYGTGLHSITIPKNIPNFGHEAFANCANLTSVTFLCNYGGVYADEFADSTNITNITICSNVTSFNMYLFHSLANLESINFENKIGWSIYNSSLTSEEIEANITDSADAVTFVKNHGTTWTRTTA